MQGKLVLAVLLVVAASTTWTSASADSCKSDKAKYFFEHRKLLLFTIKAGAFRCSTCDYSALGEIQNTGSIHTEHAAKGQLPEIYRSTLLDKLAHTIEHYRAAQIVVEMRKGGRMVSQVTFDVSNTNGLNAVNWFSPNRVVSSSPYNIGTSGYQYFSIPGYSYNGNPPHRRTFYIQFSHGGCDNDHGFMGIGESIRDPCSWVQNGLTAGRAPVLFYSTQRGRDYAKSVQYADQFLIYLPVHTAPSRSRIYHLDSKLLLFTIRAGAFRCSTCGYSVVGEIRNKASIHTEHGNNGQLPDIYRSRLLDDLSSSIKNHHGKYIVVEMRQNGKAVAQVTFDVTNSDGVTYENFFSTNRLVSSSPYWIGKNFQYFSIPGYSYAGNPKHHRSFYIQFSHGGCYNDHGFMGVGESVTDPCAWVHNGLTQGRAPVLFYSVQKGVAYHRSVKYAEQLVIYLTRAK